MTIADQLVSAAQLLSGEMGGMSFSAPVSHVYNPLDYAWEPHRLYLLRFGDTKKKTVFLGMNPGPWGMAQTGVPFGDVGMVRDWLGIEAAVDKPAGEHPKRPVEGFACARGEVSGRRLWGLFRDRFGSAGRFFQDHFVANYCPLLFVESGGRNRTPDKLPAAERMPLLEACDRHLRRLVEVLEPLRVVGVGRFSSRMARRSLEGLPVAVVNILHPSPASPAANRNWAEKVGGDLSGMGVWKDD